MNNIAPSMAWFNFRTGEYEYRQSPPTDREAPDFLPQDPAGRGTYMARRAAGDGVAQAMFHVLSAITDMPERQP